MSAGPVPVSLLAALMAGLSAVSLLRRWAGQGGGHDTLTLAVLAAGAMLVLSAPA